MKNDWIGIDYGSKLAGTTCIVWLNSQGILTIKQSEKKKDADSFITEIIQETKPISVFIDAPLSLPGAYYNNGADFFYRKADRETSAMSPMFIGGLTARAMKLQRRLNSISFYEAYPGGLARLWELQKLGYKKGNVVNREFANAITKKTEYQISDSIFNNWHCVDALLAWMIGYRKANNQCEIFGNEEEGVIYV